MWAEEYKLYTGAITEGDYIIYYSGYAMKNTISNNRLGYVEVTPVNNVITTENAAIIWHIEASGNYFTLYNSNANRYAAGTGEKNKIQLSNDGTDNYSLWSVTGTNSYNFENKGNSTDGVNAYLRRNSNYGFACYSTSTGGALYLFKKTETTSAATTITINSIGITNTNKFFGTTAGTLTATVTETSTNAIIDDAIITWESNNTSVATVEESTGVITLVGEGCTTITASYAGKTGEYKSSSAEYILNVTDNNPDAVTLWSEDFSTYSEDDKPSGGTYSYICIDGASDTQIYDANNSGGTAPELLLNKNGGSFEVTIPLENITGNLTLKFKSNAYAVTISTATPGITISGDHSFDTAGEHTVIFTGATIDMTSIKIKFAAGKDRNVRIDDIILKGSKVVPISISTAGLATIASDNALNFTNVKNLEAYIAKENGSDIILEKVNKIPAGTGALLRATKGDTYFVIPVVTTADEITDNLFKRGTGAAIESGSDPYNYVLGKHNGIVGFYKAGGMTVATDKAYIQTSVTAARINIDFDDENVTAIVEKKDTTKSKDVFNLAGLRVTQPTKGLYIVNGKKVVIK